MIETAPSRRAFLVVMSVTAVMTFLLAAAASTIVASASGPDDRELAYAANSIVVAGIDEPVQGVPAGVRVPALVYLRLGSVVADDTPFTVNESGDGAKFVYIGRSDATAAQFTQLLTSHAAKWSLVSDSAATRLHDAAIDMGARLRHGGLTAIILPDRFLAASASGCATADGLYRGGVIPIFRLGASEGQALRSCLKHFANRDASVIADGAGQKAAAGLLGNETRVTLFVETQQSGVEDALASNAAALIAGAPRDEIVGTLENSNSKSLQALVLEAARKIRRWYADAPAAGTSPTSQPPQKNTKRKNGVAVKPLTKLRTNGPSSDGRRVAPRTQTQTPGRGNPQQTAPNPGTPNGGL